MTKPLTQDQPKLTPSQKAAQTKEKKKAAEEAARREYNIRQPLERLRRQKSYYFNPKRSFKVGDKVEILGARWNGAEVVAIEDEGLFYRVRYCYEGKNDKREPIEQFGETYAAWTEIVPVGAKKSEKVFNTRKTNWMNYISFHNTSLNNLVSKHLSFGVDFNPSYQRDFVWSLADKEALIDSIFKGVEIGKFVFIHLGYEADKPGYEILDGKQRLNTILEFMRDDFTYQGVYFSELSGDDQNYFENFMITSGETRDTLTDEQKYEYFLRLNTRGVEQDPAHLKKVEDMLKEIRDKK